MYKHSGLQHNHPASRHHWSDCSFGGSAKQIKGCSHCLAESVIGSACIRVAAGCVRERTRQRPRVAAVVINAIADSSSVVATAGEGKRCSSSDWSRCVGLAKAHGWECIGNCRRCLGLLVHAWTCLGKPVVSRFLVRKPTLQTNEMPSRQQLSVVCAHGDGVCPWSKRHPLRWDNAIEQHHCDIMSSVTKMAQRL